MNFVPLDEAWGEEEFQSNLIENIFESHENYLLVKRYIIRKETDRLKNHLWDHRMYYMSLLLIVNVAIITRIRMYR